LLHISKQYIDRFHENLLNIHREHLALFEQLEEAGGDDRLVETGDGGLTLRVGSGYIESRVSPRRNAVRFAGSVEKGEKKFIFLGCGLAYHINELLREGGRGVVVERDIEVFRAALHILDPRFLGRLKLLIGLSVEEVAGRITSFIAQRMTVVKHPASSRISPRYYGRIENIIRNRRLERLASDVTAAESSKLWLRNTVKNLTRSETFGSRYILSRRCTGMFSGPVLLVASGPWLEDVIASIKRYRNNLPVFALLPSVPYLLANGIEPDLVLTTDAGFWNRHRVVSVHAIREGCTVPLVATFSCDPGVMVNWHGNVYLFSHSLAFESLLGSITGDIMSIPMQGTSSLVMLLLARILGFDTIYLAGYDFSFRGLRGHHRGAGFEQFDMERSCRFSPWDTMVLKRLRQEGYRKAGNGAGERIYTSHKLVLYKNWLEREVAGEDIVRLKGGLKVEGIKTADPGVLAQCGSARSHTIDSMLGSCAKRMDQYRVLEDLRGIRKMIEKESDPQKRRDILYGDTPNPDVKSSLENDDFALELLDRCLAAAEKREQKVRSNAL
jgi:hypothetical protein